MSPDYGPALRGVVRRAVARLQAGLRAGAPTLARPTLAWMRGLAGEAPPERYFLHPDAFPMLLLPWLLEETIHGRPDHRFQADVVTSTIAGYYAVRMIDDLMDQERQADPDTLPALIFFQVAFQRAYQRWFADGQPFWTDFEELTLASAEMAARDAGPMLIDRERFVAVSARKTVGAKVPLAAVCRRYDRDDLLGPWLELVDLLGQWHQMRNDMLGWRRDLEKGRSTYFLSKGASRTGTDSTITAWVLGDGLRWGFAELEASMKRLLVAAEDLDCRPLVDYLERRRAAVAAERDGLLGNLAALEHLAAVIH
jgi:hypothetical protein